MLIELYCGNKTCQRMSRLIFQVARHRSCVTNPVLTPETVAFVNHQFILTHKPKKVSHRRRKVDQVAHADASMCQQAIKDMILFCLHKRFFDKMEWDSSALL